MIDDLLRTALADNVGVTIWKTQDGRYQAGITPDRVSWRIEIDADPVVALERLLRPKREPTMDMFG